MWKASLLVGIDGNVQCKRMLIQCNSKTESVERLGHTNRDE